MPPRKRKKVQYSYSSESDSSCLESNSETSEEPPVTKELAKTLADRIRENSDANRRQRRRKATEPRSKVSIWTTAAVVGDTESGRAICALCSKSIAVHNKSSTNIINHYKTTHESIATSVRNANSTNEKLEILNRAISQKRASQSSMRQFIRTETAKPTPKSVSKDLVRSVCGILLAASRQVSFDVLGSPELEAFVSSAGGTIAKSKTVYVRLLPEVYSIVADIAAKETGDVKVGSFTYDGWSAQFGTPIAGMTFHYIDSSWNLKTFPLCFLSLEDLGKTANQHEAVMSAAITTNDKLGSNVVVMSGTSDNDPATALGVDQYLEFSGSVRCVCHTMALAVNDAVSECDFLTDALSQISEITKYVNYRPKISTQIAAHQCLEFSPDRIVRLASDCPTRWHSKLRIIEKYIILRPTLQKVLPENAPPLLPDADEEMLAECVTIMKEVRRIARLMEFDRQLTASRAPRLLKELVRTLNLFAADRATRATLETRERYRRSIAEDDKALKTIRTTSIRDADVRNLAQLLSDYLTDRLGYLFEPIESRSVHTAWDDISEDERKEVRESRRALVIQSACLFDINECTLDWLPATCDKKEYIEFLSDFIISEMPRVLGDDFDVLIQNKTNFLSVHEAMKSQLEEKGRTVPNNALLWWREVENSTGAMLRKRKVFQASLFTEMARAFLSIQASSAPVERLFSDSGLYEGNRRHHGNSSIEEMLFTIRSCVQQRIMSRKGQSLFISAHAEAVMDFATEIAVRIKK